MFIGSGIGIKCPSCDKISTARDWNNGTFKECKGNKQAASSYMPIMNTKAFKRETEAYYKCPKCKTWNIGSKLWIEDDRYKHLGREPLVEIIRNSN